MKISFITFLFLLCSGVNAQDMDCNQIDSLNKKQGLWVVKSHNEIQIGNYYNDLKSGLWVVRDSIMKIKKIASYDKGTLEGKSYIFNQNGIITKELEFLNGNLNGKAKFYSKQGTLLAIYTYVNGIRNLIEYYVVDKESPPRNHDYYPDF